MGTKATLWAYLDLLREFKEALVNKAVDGVVGAFFGVCEVLLTGLGFDSASEPPTAAKRERFGEGGGRLHMTTDQH